MSDRKLRIAVDADDTVMDQASLLLMLLNWNLGKSIRKEELVWNFFLSDPAIEKAFWGVYEMYDQSYLRRAMPPTDSFAFPVLRELQKRGHVVEIVTRNNSESVSRIRDWMWMHGVEIRVRAIKRATVKMVNGKEKDNTGTKARLPYDIFIDDSPLLVEPIHHAPSKRLILYSQPWNKHVEPTKNIFRANGWLEVRKILQAMGAL